MPLRVAVIMPCWNEAVLLPYFFRNYAWAERILVFDNRSTDDSRAIVKRYPKAEVRDFDTKGVHDDIFLTEIKNTAWKEFRGKGYDYVCVVDGDEFLWAPDIVGLLRRYKMAGITLVQPT